jgi:hypothetical protein
MDPARVQEIVRQLALASPDRYDQMERLANTVASVPSVFTATAAKAAVAELVETAPPVLTGVVSAVGSFMGLDELVNATQVHKSNNCSPRFVTFSVKKCAFLHLFG